MKTRRFFSPHWKVILACLALVLVTLFIQASTNPPYTPMDTDSGIFAYCGQRILHGDLLYRDCFDNKPPGVYYINALIMLLFGPSPIGIWWFQSAWMAGTGVLFFLLVRRMWDGWSGFLAALILLFTVQQPEFYTGGNITETYALGVLVLILWFLWSALTRPRRSAWIALGVLTALAFLLKPTNIVLGAAAGLTVLLSGLARDRSRAGLRRAAAWAGWMLAGLLVPLLVVLVYFWARGGLWDMVFAVFIEPRAYVQAGFSLWSVKEAFLDFLFGQPLALLSGLSIAAAGVLAFEVLRARQPVQVEQPGASAVRWVVFAALLSLPLDIFLVNLSGRGFGHYFLIPLPAMALCAAYVFSKAVFALRRRESAGMAAAAALAVLCIPWANYMFQRYENAGEALPAFFSPPPFGPYQPTDLEQYIRDHSGPQDAVLLLSPHPSINLLAGRRTPTRYIFPPHLLSPVPTGPTGLPELVSELQEDPPTLIVFQEGSSANIPDFRGNDPNICGDCSPDVRAGMRQLRAYIYENYEFDTQVWDFFIYQRSESPQPQ